MVRESVKLDAKQARARYYLGFALFKSGDKKHALESFQTGIDPRAAKRLFRRAIRLVVARLKNVGDLELFR